MLEQINLLHKIIGVLGVLLIINAILIMVFPKYYLFFSRSFFIESATDIGKNEAREKIKKDEKSQRYILGFVAILLGTIAIHWALGGHFSLLW